MRAVIATNTAPSGSGKEADIAAQVAAGRAPAARTSGPPLSSDRPRGTATRLATSASACPFSGAVIGAMPARSDNAPSAAAGTRTKA